MKRLFILLLLFSVFTAQAQENSYLKQYSLYKEEYGRIFLKTKDSGYLHLAYTFFDPTNRNCSVVAAKLDKDGNTSWLKVFKKDYETPEGALELEDGSFLIASWRSYATPYHALIVRHVSSSGLLLKTKQYWIGDFQAGDIAFSKNGYVVFGGARLDTVKYGSVHFRLELDTALDSVTTIFPKNDPGPLYKESKAADTREAFLSLVYDKVNYTTTPILKRLLPGGNLIQKTGSKVLAGDGWYQFDFCPGGYFLQWVTKSYQSVSENYYARYDTGFNLIWEKRYANSHHNQGGSMICEDSSCLMAGSVDFGHDSYIYLHKLDNKGDTLWTKKIYQFDDWGGYIDFAINNIVKTYDGGYAIGGTAYNSLVQSHQMFILKIGKDGNFVGITQSPAPIGAELSLSPNPVAGLLNIRLSSSNQGLVDISVRDISGRVVASVSSKKSRGLFSEDIDMSRLPTGIYIVSIQGGEGVIVRRVVKE